MKSPFPGMDPFLEAPAFWEGFHHVFITECMYALSDCLPAGYVANIGERVELISFDDPAAKEFLPDVPITRSARMPSSVQEPVGREGGGTAVAVEPVTIPSVDSFEVRQGYIKIVRQRDQKLVTSIEVLSPSNKFGDGIGEYRHKRRAMLSHGVHVVEVDFLRRGRRTELARPLPPGHYYCFVFRANRQPDVNVYAWDLRQPLPTISIPLATPDPDVQLDLGMVVGSAYERGRYDRKLQYREPPPEPLAPADADWAVEIARKAAVAS